MLSLLRSGVYFSSSIISGGTEGNNTTVTSQATLDAMSAFVLALSEITQSHQYYAVNTPAALWCVHGLKAMTILEEVLSAQSTLQMQSAPADSLITVSQDSQSRLAKPFPNSWPTERN